MTEPKGKIKLLKLLVFPVVIDEDLREHGMGREPIVIAAADLHDFPKKLEDYITKANANSSKRKAPRPKAKRPTKRKS